jgi:glycosyltransferase involved in cell wall biosynthesis
MNKKLLVVGSSSIHTYSLIELVKDYFDEVLLLTDIKKEIAQPYTVVGVDFRLQSFKTIFQIRDIAKEFSPTHIHIHQANSYAFLTLLALKQFKAYKVLNAWGSDILLNPKKNFFLKQMVKYNLKNVDIVTADSFTVLEEAKKLVPSIHTENINFGIDFVECHDKKENIIYSNRLHKELYNIDKVIISFSKFVQNNMDWKLVIAGSGEDTKNLQKLCDDLGIQENVDFIGFVDKETNFKYYCKAKIYISIPKSDSVSLSLIEAIASTCVVFVSNLKANKEIVSSNIGFIEDNLEDIDFNKYKKIDKIKQTQQIEKLKYLFSKEYNRQRYIKLYEN